MKMKELLQAIELPHKVKEIDEKKLLLWNKRVSSPQFKKSVAADIPGATPRDVETWWIGTVSVGTQGQPYIPSPIAVSCGVWLTSSIKKENGEDLDFLKHIVSRVLQKHMKQIGIENLYVTADVKEETEYNRFGSGVHETGAFAKFFIIRAPETLEALARQFQLKKVA